MSWINFKKLRNELSFRQVLDHYQVEYKVKAERASCFCPLPGHNGKRRSPSFSADLTRGLFQCFGCGAKGNVLEFACLMEKLDPQDSRDFYKVCSELEERFFGKGKVVRPQAKQEARRSKPAPSSPAKRNLPVLVNPPLDFELQNLDPEHPYLLGRGFTPRTIERFGLGFCNRGSLKDRIAIPLRNPAGELIGYAGRVVDDELISPENPKYLFPSERERDGKIHKFMKSLVLYNGDGILGPVKDLVVVEGFPAVWWLWQNGVQNVVGLMGASCSKEQAALIVDLVEPTGVVWVFADGDEAGKRCAASVFLQIAPERFVRRVVCEDGAQPTDWMAEEILGSFGEAQQESGSSDESIGASLGKGHTDKTQTATAAFD